MGVIKNRISDFGGTRELFTPSPMRTQRRNDLLDGNRPSPDADSGRGFILDFPVSGTRKNKYLLLINYSV